MKRKLLGSVLVLLSGLFCKPLWSQTDRKQMNIIFILADDHRYDAMGFMNTIPGLKTPGMDRMARRACT